MQTQTSAPAAAATEQPKRILLVVDDKLLLKFYEEKLEENGFKVTTARELDKATIALTREVPEMIFVDLLFQSGNVIDFISSVRSGPALKGLPIIILPTTANYVVNQALEAGASFRIEPGNNPLAAIIDRARLTVGLQGLGASANSDVFKVDDFWTDAIFANAIDSINRMRHCLPGIAENPPELEALHNLWCLSHAFAQKAALLPYRPFVQLATALDTLVHDLNQSPEQINASTLRTIGQALDFLATISKPECLSRLKDLAASSMLVVDDEDGARTFITSALQLAGLKNETAESPATALDKLTRSNMNLIFLDVGLPEMNGFELCTKVRAIDQYKSTPIVFLTGMATFQNKAKASLSGGNDFVGKPFNLPELGVKALMWLCRGQLSMV